MAIKSVVSFVSSRLIRTTAMATALEINPSTVFGIKDGKILNRSKECPGRKMLSKLYDVGLLMPGAKFKPPLTETSVRTPS
jgi:hypothetical protein